MATIAHQLSKTDSRDFTYERLGTLIVKWETLGAGDSGDWVDVSNYADLTFHAEGTFSGSGRADIQGTNFDSTNPQQLNDLDGNSLQFSSAGIGVTRESPRMVRPNINSGDGSTDIDVIMVAKR